MRADFRRSRQSCGDARRGYAAWHLLGATAATLLFRWLTPARAEDIVVAQEEEQRVRG